jgi:23S rRNA G2445 N2-methylase RlmL
MDAWSQSRPLLIACAKGLSPYLAAEIRALGLPVRAENETSVETEGTLADATRLNLWLRTAQRVMFPVREFRARTPEELYQELVRAPWEQFIPADGYLTVDGVVANEWIRDPRFANMKCKDAIVDRIRHVHGRRPDSGPENSGAAVFLYWKGDRGVAYLNTSGEALARRGYRRIPLEAPMQETLAAGVVLATGWTGQDAFVNPMCGSGTLAIEAAWIATNRAPGLLREDFAFKHLLGFDSVAWARLRAAALDAVRPAPAAKIVATDLRPKAIEAARKNARDAGVERLIAFHVCDFADTPIPEGGGAVVLNPEYGERMGDAEALGGVYARIGDFLKQRCAGYRGFVFTGSSALAKAVGLRTSRRIPFFNSRIECRLLQYDLYAGTRRTDRPDE